MLLKRSRAILIEHGEPTACHFFGFGCADDSTHQDIGHAELFPLGAESGESPVPEMAAGFQKKMPHLRGYGLHRWIAAGSYRRRGFKTLLVLDFVDDADMLMRHCKRIVGLPVVQESA